MKSYHVLGKLAQEQKQNSGWKTLPSALMQTLDKVRNFINLQLESRDLSLFGE